MPKTTHRNWATPAGALLAAGILLATALGPADATAPLEATTRTEPPVVPAGSGVTTLAEFSKTQTPEAIAEVIAQARADRMVHIYVDPDTFEYLAAAFEDELGLPDRL